MPATFPRPRFRLATLLLAMIPLGILFLYMRWWLDVPPKLKWQPYSPQLVEQELAEGRTVVVHFFGMWDPTCVLNLSLFEKSEALRRQATTHRVSFLAADWTETSEPLFTEMRRLGFQTVPATVVFRPDGSPPRVMLDIVTAEQLIEELRRPPLGKDMPRAATDRHGSNTDGRS